MPADKSSSKTPKIMDVAQPGKSTPPASSRPIIVTNRPLIKQDPMVLGTTEGQEAASVISRVGKPIRIEPIDASGDALKAITPVKPQPKGEVPIEVKSAKLSLKPLAEPAKDTEPAAAQEPPAEPTGKATSEPPAATAPAADTASTDIPGPTDSQEAPEGDKQLAANKTLEDAKKKAEEERVARVAEQEKVIESKKYYLPLSSTRDGRDLHLALLLLLAVIVLGLVWLDIALDAGIIKINGLHALTHFFNK